MNEKKLLNDKDRFEILDREYELMGKDLNEAYSIIQNRIGLFVTAYAFIFAGYVALLTQLNCFKKYVLLILIELAFLFLSFLLTLPALFITSLKKWNSFGNPKETTNLLKKSKYWETYYLEQGKNKVNTIRNNKDINNWSNYLLISSFSLLLLTLFIIFLHIIISL